MSLIKGDFSSDQEDICAKSPVDIKYPIHIGPVFACFYCKTNFINLFFLQKHSLKCIAANIHVLDESIFEFIKQRDQMLRKKAKNKTSYKNKIKITPRIDNSNLIPYSKKTYICEICSKQYYQKNDLTRHQRTHTGEKPFKCIVCQKEFSQKSHLLQHHRKHSGEKPFKCEVCMKQFSRKSHLKEHSLVHSGEKSFQCHICTKQFSLKSHLTRHIRTHSGEKPFDCHICQKQFSRTSHLKDHLRTHSGEKPFKCEVCNNLFTAKHSLIKHLQRHKDAKAVSSSEADLSKPVAFAVNKDAQSPPYSRLLEESDQPMPVVVTLCEGNEIL